MPSFLLAVGVGNAVHIFAVFFQGMDRGDSKQDAIAYALSHSGFAIAMTAFTTAGGLLSFTTATVKPAADFGLTTAIGIGFTLIYAVVLLPALIAVTPLKHKPRRDNKNSPQPTFSSAMRFDCF